MSHLAELTPPLPLLRFAKDEKSVDLVKTIGGEGLSAIPNILYGNPRVKGEKIFDPLRSRRLAKWFAARSVNEINFRQTEALNRHIVEVAPPPPISAEPLTSPRSPTGRSKPELKDITVYESYLFLESKTERQQRSSKIRLEELQLLSSPLFSFDDDLTMGGNNNGNGNTQSISKESSNPDIKGGVVEQKEGVASGLPPALINPDNSNNLSPSSIPLPLPPPGYTYSSHGPSLFFDSEFESGNLERSVRVLGRDHPNLLVTERTRELLFDYSEPSAVDHEYDLTIRNDVNTDGNIQWFYFAVTVPPDCCLPLTVRFNIVNMMKKDALFSYGMRPAVYVEPFCSHGSNSINWSHGGYDVCYFKNGRGVSHNGNGGNNKKKGNSKQGNKSSSQRSLYTLSWTFSFEQPNQRVFFASAFPFTYSDQLRSLNQLESRDLPFLHRRTLAMTLAGNRCELLTISERADQPAENRARPAVIVTARVHPGETSSSFMIQGLIDFLCSEAPEAQKLRRAFIFTIVPMLNPDGVIHGNYRCSLAGCDLNRRYGHNGEEACLYPTIAAFKQLVKAIVAARPVALYLDLHGHSRKKNCFLYGCDPALYEGIAPPTNANASGDSGSSAKKNKGNSNFISGIPPSNAAGMSIASSLGLSHEELNSRRIFSRLYPRLLHSLSPSTSTTGYFSYKDSCFGVSKGKAGTGRVVLWRELGIAAAYTVEVSFCGGGNNEEGKMLRKYDDLVKNYRRTSVSSFGIAGGDDYGLTSSSNNSYSNHNYSSNRHGSVVTEGSTTVTEVPLSALDLDQSFKDLLSSYKTATHYSKADLLSMGRGLLLGLYHLGNLGHSDLDRELELLLAADRDQRNGYDMNGRRLATAGVISGLYGPGGRGYSFDENNQNRNSNNSNNNRPASAAARLRGMMETRYTFPDRGQGNNSNIPSSPSAIPGFLEMTIPSPTNVSNHNSGGATSSTRQRKPSLSLSMPSSARANVTNDTSSLASSLVDNSKSQQPRKSSLLAQSLAAAVAAATAATNDTEDDSDNGEEEGNSDEEDGDGNPRHSSSVNIHQQAQHQTATATSLTAPFAAINLTSINTNNSSSNHRYNASLTSAMQRAPRIDQLEASMLRRALLKPAVFTPAALQAILSQHGQEMTAERSTINVGLRVKVELAVRRALRLDWAGLDRLSLPGDHNSNSAKAGSSGDEEGGDSEEGGGSDSNPSIDNNRKASRLLLSGGGKGLDMVATLRAVLQKKAKKEEEASRKADAKAERRLRKQAARIQEERLAEAENQAALQRERDRQTWLLAQQANRPSTAGAGGRRSSAAPRFIPSYRLAPPNEVKAAAPIQIRLMSFKDSEQLTEEQQQVAGNMEDDANYSNNNNNNMSSNSSTNGGGSTRGRMTRPRTALVSSSFSSPSSSSSSFRANTGNGNYAVNNAANNLGLKPQLGSILQLVAGAAAQQQQQMAKSNNNTTAAAAARATTASGTASPARLSFPAAAAAASALDNNSSNNSLPPIAVAHSSSNSDSPATTRVLLSPDIVASNSISNNNSSNSKGQQQQQRVAVQQLTCCSPGPDLSMNRMTSFSRLLENSFKQPPVEEKSSTPKSGKGSNRGRALTLSFSS